MFTINTLSNVDCVTKLQGKRAAVTTTQQYKQSHRCCERKHEINENSPKGVFIISEETEQVL